MLDLDCGEAIATTSALRAYRDARKMIESVLDIARESNKGGT